MMRSVVGCDGVDRSVLDAFDNGSKMLLASQRRSHFGVSVVTLDCFVGQREMMRCDLAGYVDALIFCTTNSFDTTFCRHVRDVNASTGFLREHNVPDDVDLLGESGHAF